LSVIPNRLSNVRNAPRHHFWRTKSTSDIPNCSQKRIHTSRTALPAYLPTRQWRLGVSRGDAAHRHDSQVGLLQDGSHQFPGRYSTLATYEQKVVIVKRGGVSEFGMRQQSSTPAQRPLAWQTGGEEVSAPVLLSYPSDLPGHQRVEFLRAIDC
jgi:hypothetical protein